MKGSLNQPPIIIRTARWKAGLHLAVVALVGVLCSPVLRTKWLDNAYAWFVIAIFGIVAAASLWELIWPGRLVIGPEGFEQRDLWRARRWSWAEARRFAPARNRFYDFVGFDHVAGRAPPRRGLWPGSDGLNQDWELAPAALAALLNQARAQWFRAQDGS